MLSSFQLFSSLCIFCVALAGGYYPLIRRDLAGSRDGFPLGQAFAAGVFLALSLSIMLPNGSHLLTKAFPQVTYPVASVLSLAAYLGMLALGHTANVRMPEGGQTVGLTTPLIPIIMTIMIAIPSFLLGTALGVSGTAGAIVIFIAIVLHKGSAGFALALAMVRSTMTKTQTFILYGLFAFATPVGIVVGAEIHQYLSSQIMLVIKGTILSLASGVFFYMGTLHEMKHSPLIIQCCTVRGFIVMFAGLILTLLVRLLVGLGHTGNIG
jgi:zinc transporter 1/2/3